MAEAVFSINLWFLILIGLIIFASIKLYKWVWGELHPFSIVWGFFSFIALIVVIIAYVVITNNIFNGYLRQPHRQPVVDATPLASLTEEQMMRFEDAIIRLAYLGYIEESSFFEVSDVSRTALRFYSTKWISESPRFRTNTTTRLGISVTVHRYEETASSRIHYRGQRNPEHRHIQNDNNTEAVLIHPWMPVSASGLFLPSDDRRIRSDIRINNATISLTEYRHWVDVRNNYSSLFIAALVDAMQEE